MRHDCNVMYALFVKHDRLSCRLACVGIDSGIAQGQVLRSRGLALEAEVLVTVVCTWHVALIQRINRAPGHILEGPVFHDRGSPALVAGAPDDLALGVGQFLWTMSSAAPT